jgi:hypothetical protein
VDLHQNYKAVDEKASMTFQIPAMLEEQFCNDFCRDGRNF